MLRPYCQGGIHSRERAAGHLESVRQEPDRKRRETTRLKTRHYWAEGGRAEALRYERAALQKKAVKERRPGWAGARSKRMEMAVTSAIV